MEYDNRPIGVFDSGVGGLTIAYELLKVLPCEKFIYFGDSLRAPYGNLEPKKLFQYACEIIDYFITLNVKAIVVACNTICATVLEDIEDKYKASGILFQGLIEISAKEAVESESKNIGILATSNTIKYGVHKKFIKELDKNINVVEKAAPIFVPLTENGLHNTRMAYEGAKFYLKDMIDAKVDTIILACTHFPIMIKALQEAADEYYPIKFINPAKRVAIELDKRLGDNDMKGNFLGKIEFKASGYEENFKFVLNIIFEVGYDVEIINLAKE
ncbi:MAG: glutamate racemase [Lachnospirales bacterium]